MSTRQDPSLDTKRRLYALILVLAFMLAALASTGCAGINFRHMRVDGVTLPDALYTQYRRVAGPEQLAQFGMNYECADIPRIVGGLSSYSRGRAYRQVRTLALWSIERGYDCEILILRRKGWQAHPVLAVNLDGKDVIFDPALHRMYTKLSKWQVVARFDEDDITHKGILGIARQLCPTNQPNESKKGNTNATD